MQAWVTDETLWKLGKDGSPCRVNVPQGYRCESDSLDMDDLVCIPRHAPDLVHSKSEHNDTYNAACFVDFTHTKEAEQQHDPYMHLGSVQDIYGYVSPKPPQPCFACHVAYWDRVPCSFDEDDAESSSLADKEERSHFQELSPTANLLQSQNAAGQLASAPHCAFVHLAWRNAAGWEALLYPCEARASAQNPEIPYCLDTTAPN